VRILNKSLESRAFVLKVSGLPDSDVDVIGSSTFFDANPLIDVGPDQSREARVLVTARERVPTGTSIPITFTIVPKTGGTPVSANDHFFGP